MGIASFFCIHYIVVFPVSLFALVILRPFNWREWSVLLIGLLTPLYIYVSICYLATNDAFVVFGMMKEATSIFALRHHKIQTSSSQLNAKIGSIILNRLKNLYPHMNVGIISSHPSQPKLMMPLT